MNVSPTQSPPEGCYFFLDKKVTKKSRQQNSFFAARAFALQIQQNHGLHYVALLRLRKANASATKRYAPAIAQASSSVLFHPKLICCQEKEKIKEPDKLSVTFLNRH